MKKQIIRKFTQNKKPRIAEFDIRLDKTEKGYNLGIQASIYSSSRKTCFQCGQCQDTLKEFKGWKSDIKKLLEVWDVWHLNDLVPGDEVQMEFLKDKEYNDYNEACVLLEKAGILIHNGYEYGSAWKRKEIPSEVIDFLTRLE